MNDVLTGISIFDLYGIASDTNKHKQVNFHLQGDYFGIS